MNSTFRACWLASSEVISQVLFTSDQPKKNKMAFVAIFSQILFYFYFFTFTLWAANYSACVVYTKTIIHLSFSESGGYLPPLRWIIVNYYLQHFCRSLQSLNSLQCLRKDTTLFTLHYLFIYIYGNNYLYVLVCK